MIGCLCPQLSAGLAVILAVVTTVKARRFGSGEPND